MIESGVPRVPLDPLDRSRAGDLPILTPRASTGGSCRGRGRPPGQGRSRRGAAECCPAGGGSISGRCSEPAGPKRWGRDQPVTNKGRHGCALRKIRLASERGGSVQGAPPFLCRKGVYCVPACATLRGSAATSSLCSGSSTEEVPMEEVVVHHPSGFPGPRRHWLDDGRRQQGDHRQDLRGAQRRQGSSRPGEPGSRGSGGPGCRFRRLWRSFVDYHLQRHSGRRRGGQCR